MNLINRSADYELYDLAKKLNINNFVITNKKDLPKYLKDKKIKNIILNIGESTHWTALYKPDKIYFDSYAQLPPKIIKDYKPASTIKEIESIDGQNCGQLCILFLYYCNYKSKQEFYKLFKDLY